MQQPIPGTQQSFSFSRYHVPIIVRALRALEFLVERPEGCGVTELADGLKIPTNPAFRILTTRAEHGSLARNAEGKTYRLDRRLLNLGCAAIDEAGRIEKSIEVLRD